MYSRRCEADLQPTASRASASKSQSSSSDAPDDSSAVILKLYCIPALHDSAVFFFSLSLYLWPAGNRAYLKGTDLAEQPDCLLSPDCKSPHTLHAFPLFMTHWQRIRSVLDWFRLSEPWQSQGIMLRFLSSTTFSKWIPCSKRTTRTSSGGKTRTKLRFCAQRVAQNSPRWSEQ